MTAELKPELEAIVQRQLRSGAFANPEEDVKRALEFLALEEDWLAHDRAEIAAQVQVGWDAAQRGELIGADQVHVNLAKRREAWLADRRRR